MMGGWKLGEGMCLLDVPKGRIDTPGPINTNNIDRSSPMGCREILQRAFWEGVHWSSSLRALGNRVDLVSSMVIWRNWETHLQRGGNSAGSTPAMITQNWRRLPP